MSGAAECKVEVLGVLCGLLVVCLSVYGGCFYRAVKGGRGEKSGGSRVACRGSGFWG